MMAHPKWASENANVPVICIIFETMFFPILIVLLPVVFFSLKKKILHTLCTNRVFK